MSTRGIARFLQTEGIKMSHMTVSRRLQEALIRMQQKITESCITGE
jgi:arginine repressor